MFDKDKVYGGFGESHWLKYKFVGYMFESLDEIGSNMVADLNGNVDAFVYKTGINRDIQYRGKEVKDITPKKYKVAYRHEGINWTISQGEYYSEDDCLQQNRLYFRGMKNIQIKLLD